MINIYRKIRKQLAAEDKVGKYMKYAFGEIVLVVVGILIALSINNWNEDRKSKAFEVKMLIEVRNDLVHDSLYFHRIIVRNETVLSSVEHLISLFNNENIPTDTVMKYVKTMERGSLFLYQSGAFEAFKAIGLDKISNDSLRNSLINIYDFQFPRVKELIGFRKLRNDLEKNRLVEILFEKQLIVNKGRNIIVNVPRSAGLLHNLSFLAYIKIYQSESRNFEFRLNLILTQVKTLIDQLNNELKILE